MVMDTLIPWQRVRVHGSSMTPTLAPGDLVLVRHGAGVRPGAIVLGRFRALPGVPVLKRAVSPRDGGWLLTSDNARAGSDSRQHGVADVQARAVWIWHRRLGGVRGTRWSAIRRWMGEPARVGPALDL